MNSQATTVSNVGDPGRADKTMELLWTRVRQRGDLPGFSKVVSAIIGAMRGDDDREFNMTRTVLQDPALTQKVLRLANSAMYSVFGQGINTVSKAVIVLGTEAIGHLALGLKLIDGLSYASSDSASARTELEKAVLAGHIARQVVSAASTRDAEEAVVCSMLHSLGRMMTTFYLPERWQEIYARVQETGLADAEVAA
jgi:HD-like signal output (HDOD) protein